MQADADFDPSLSKPGPDLATAVPKREEEYQRPPAPEAHDFVRSMLPGEAIAHPVYGEGEVVRLRLRGDRAEVEAAFLASDVGAELPHSLMSRYLDDSKEMVAVWFDEHCVFEDEDRSRETGERCWAIDDQTGWIYLADTMWLIPKEREEEERDRLLGTTWKRRQAEMEDEPEEDEDEDFVEDDGDAESRFPPATRAAAAEAGIIDEISDAEDDDDGNFEIDEDAEEGVVTGLDERDFPVEGEELDIDFGEEEKSDNK